MNEDKLSRTDSSWLSLSPLGKGVLHGEWVVGGLPIGSCITMLRPSAGHSENLRADTLVGRSPIPDDVNHVGLVKVPHDLLRVATLGGASHLGGQYWAVPGSLCGAAAVGDWKASVVCWCLRKGLSGSSGGAPSYTLCLGWEIP